MIEYDHHSKLESLIYNVLYFLYYAGVAELEEGDSLELQSRPPTVIKTDNSYANTFKNLEELGK